MVVAPYLGGWALNAGIEMIINLLGHPMSVQRSHERHTRYSGCLLICIVSK